MQWAYIFAKQHLPLWLLQGVLPVIHIKILGELKVKMLSLSSNRQTSYPIDLSLWKYILEVYEILIKQNHIHNFHDQIIVVNSGNKAKFNRSSQNVLFLSEDCGKYDVTDMTSSYSSQFTHYCISLCICQLKTSSVLTGGREILRESKLLLLIV